MILGIESTAHTFSFGIVDSSGTPGHSCSAFLRPKEGGIHPREAADHHAENSPKILQNWLESNNLHTRDIGAIAYSQGPGLAPCLRVGASVARALSTSLDIPLLYEFFENNSNLSMSARIAQSSLDFSRFRVEFR